MGDHRHTLRALADDHIFRPQGRSVTAVDRAELSRQLLAAGIDPRHESLLNGANGLAIDATDGDGASGLLRAVRAGEVSLVKLYLDAGADADLADRTLVTPLLAAAKLQNVGLLGLLRAGGASDQVLSRGGKTSSEVFWEQLVLVPYNDLDGDESSLGLYLPESFYSSVARVMV